MDDVVVKVRLRFPSCPMARRRGFVFDSGSWRSAVCVCLFPVDLIFDHDIFFEQEACVFFRYREKMEPLEVPHVAASKAT